jgi:sulfur relay (sulfurtransferase) complex TusBCD TusD component (DsrE family)
MENKMEQITIIINSGPYGTENPYDALRLALALNEDEVRVNIFLLADGVWAGQRGQSVPQGYYNIERMLQMLLSSGAKIKACGTCMKARGLDEEALIEGIEKATMADLAQWVKESGKVLCF